MLGRKHVKKKASHWRGGDERGRFAEFFTRLIDRIIMLDDVAVDGYGSRYNAPGSTRLLAQQRHGRLKNYGGKTITTVGE